MLFLLLRQLLLEISPYLERRNSWFAHLFNRKNTNSRRSFRNLNLAINRNNAG